MRQSPLPSPGRKVAALGAPALAAALVLTSAAGASAETSSSSEGHESAAVQQTRERQSVKLPAAIGMVKNLDIGRHGRIVFAENAQDGVLVRTFTEDGRRGTLSTLATLPKGSANAGQNSRGVTWVVYGLAGGPEEPTPAGVEASSAWRVDGQGKAHKVLDLAAFQQQHSPDPYDLESQPGESNPYDVEVMPDGSALVADAAGNDLLRVWPNGRAVTVACFPDELVSTAAVPPSVRQESGPLPDKLNAEAVPTGVSLGPDGMAYVSELKGFPFPVGASKVWKVDPKDENVGCDGTPDTPVAPGKVATEGFSGIDDVTVDRRGNQYVTELDATDGIWGVEMGMQDPSSLAGKGRVTKVARGGKKSVVGDTPLTVPGATAVTRQSHVYVSDGHLTSGQLVRID